MDTYDEINKECKEIINELIIKFAGNGDMVNVKRIINMIVMLERAERNRKVSSLDDTELLMLWGLQKIKERYIDDGEDE